MSGEGFEPLFQLLDLIDDLEKRAILRAEELTRERGVKVEAEEDEKQEGEREKG